MFMTVKHGWGFLKWLVGLAKNKVVWGIVLLSLAAIVFSNQKKLTSPATPIHAQAEKNLHDLASFDPEAAKLIQQIKDNRIKNSILATAYSASDGGEERSVLQEMATKMADSQSLPYQTKLLELVWDDKMATDPDLLEGYLTSHAMTCEMLEMGGDENVVGDYINLLKQARNDPHVWKVVRDDPMAMVIWSQCESNPHELLEFYVRNREWLAEPLILLDVSGADTYNTMAKVLKKLSKHEASLKLALEDAKLGVFGVSVLLTHGELVDECYQKYDIHPGESISVIYMNQDIFTHLNQDMKKIREKAAEMAMIESQHSVVWQSAKNAPFALQLYFDVPHIADALLTQYGGDMIQLVIYQSFSGKEANAAAHAIEKYGDLAIYVINRYKDDEEKQKKIGEFLINKDLGIRIIPFFIRFGGDSFKKINDDFAWVDRYFDKSGNPRNSANDWIKDIPGGAIVNVASNWSKGHPNEWSEIGWAAWDVADVALVVVSFGTSESASIAVKSGLKSALRKGASSATRKTTRQSWKLVVKKVENKTLLSIKNRCPKLYQGTRKLIKLRRSVTSGGSVVIMGGYRLAKKPLEIVYQGAHKSLNRWKKLSPKTKKWAYRGLLAGSMFISLTERTLPNLKKIGQGMGKIIGQAAAATIKLPGQTLASATTALKDELLDGVGSVGRLVVYYLILTLSLVMGGGLLFLSLHRKNSNITVKV